MFNECEELRNVVQERLTHNSLITRYALFLAADAIMIWSILHEGIVVERPGRLPILISFPNQAREVFLAQKSQDAIHITCRGRLVQKHPVPTQVVHNSYYLLL